MFQYFSHSGILARRRGRRVERGIVVLRVHQHLPLLGGDRLLAAPSMGRPNCLTTSAGESFVPSASVPVVGREAATPERVATAGPQPAPSLPWSER